VSGINAGDLDRQITLITGVKTQDSGSGEEIIVWDADAPDAAKTVWAEWLPAGSREAWQAQQRLESYVDGAWRIYDVSPAPTPDGTRILYNGMVFDVKPPIEIGRSEGWIIPVVARGEGSG